MERLLGYSPELRFEEARQGDQRYYVSDIGKFSQATGWFPAVGVGEGVQKLHAWLTRSFESDRAATLPHADAPRPAPAAAVSAGVR
jgi:CDP-paratose 2-epimerase